MPIDIDVVVEGDGQLLPFSEHVRCGRQRAHRRPVEGLEDAAAGARQALERPIVQFHQQRPDRGIQLIEAEEALMSQPRQNPAIHQ